jgi:hypothetical protein
MEGQWWIGISGYGPEPPGAARAEKSPDNQSLRLIFLRPAGLLRGTKILNKIPYFFQVDKKRGCYFQQPLE